MLPAARFPIKVLLAGDVVRQGAGRRSRIWRLPDRERVLYIRASSGVSQVLTKRAARLRAITASKIHDGSPFILIDAVKTAEEMVNQTRGRKPRPIFILDQYGYSDVPIEMIAKIMKALPKAEVFLTLAYGWIGAYARGAKAQALRIQKSLHIAPHLQGFADGSRDAGEIPELPAGDKVAAMASQSYRGESRRSFRTASRSRISMRYCAMRRPLRRRSCASR
jgi:hypothetical protein